MKNLCFRSCNPKIYFHLTQVNSLKLAATEQKLNGSICLSLRFQRHEIPWIRFEVGVLWISKNCNIKMPPFQRFIPKHKHQ